MRHTPIWGFAFDESPNRRDRRTDRLNLLRCHRERARERAEPSQPSLPRQTQTSMFASSSESPCSPNKARTQERAGAREGWGGVERKMGRRARYHRWHHNAIPTKHRATIGIKHEVQSTKDPSDPLDGSVAPASRARIVYSGSRSVRDRSTTTSDNDDDPNPPPRPTRRTAARAIDPPSTSTSTRATDDRETDDRATGVPRRARAAAPTP